MKLGDCQLDREAQLLRRADGSVAELRPQAWGVLRLLAESPGQLVTKDRFMQAIWPDVVVTEGSLTQAVSDLRAALGPAGHRLVRTVARRGYLLAVEAASAVEPASPPALPASRALFGRDDDLRGLAGRLATARLVTVLGAGGIGKTSLALEAAHRATGQGRQVAWVDLGSLAEAAWLPAALARALDLPLAQQADPVPALCAALRPLQALVVLDNAEHLVDAVARLVRAALDAAPGLSFLCTSQAPLHLEGEHLFRLGGLDGTAPGSPAVALFVEQVRAADHRFEPDAAAMEAIARICRRLDGVPLAIRLAAGRARLLGLAALEARLGERLSMLSGERRDAPERQQTLRAALDWSHALLPEGEQRVLRRLAVFNGDFSPWMAAAAAGEDEWRLLDALQTLADRSFIEPAAAGDARWRLPETMRTYGLQQLAAHGEHEAAPAALARAVERALQRDKTLQWNQPRAWLARWTPELAAVRAALDWSAAHDVALFAAIVGQSLGLFVQLDLGHELFARMEAVGTGPIEALEPLPRAHYWLARAHLACGAATRHAQDCALAAERAARSTGARMSLHLALCLRLTTLAVPDAEAESVLAEMQRLEKPHWPARLRSHGRLAETVAHFAARRWPQALAAAEQGYALACASGSAIASALFAPWILSVSSRLEGCPRALERAAGMAGQLQAAPVAIQIPYLATCAYAQLQVGRLGSAKALLAQVFRHSRTVGWASFSHFADQYAELALADGRAEDAARLLGHAELTRRAAWVMAPMQDAGAALHAALGARLPAGRLQRLRAEGARLDPEAVVRLTLGGEVADA